MLPPNHDEACKNVAAALGGARRVLVATHVNPDGDAVGSVAALAHLAKRCGAEARILLMAGLPGFLSWLSLPAPVIGSLAELGGWVPDLLVIADCGATDRAGPELGPVLDGLAPRPCGWEETTTANIDHHISNKGYADINWVNPRAAATGELVGRLADELGAPLEGPLGEALYLALVSDTGNFTFSVTSGASLAMAARIVEQGLEIESFTSKYENVWSLERMRLWGRLFGTVTLHAGGSVACSVVYREWLDELGVSHEDLEGYASWLRRIRGVRVGVFVREKAPGQSKISLRSLTDFDVQEVCALYGGGGHAAAAGADLKLPPQEAAATVIAEIEARMRKG